MPAPAAQAQAKDRVPPDGGYGWVVCGAYALNNIIIIPIIQNFGLIYKDLFFKLGLTGTDIAIIMNVNNAFGLALGLFNGPLLRRFGYRKCGIVAALLISSGVGLTSFSTSFVEFLIFYGIIMSAGSALTMTSFSYAVNSYFLKRRTLAMGLAMSITGLGPIFMPLLISLGIKEFGPRGTSLLLSGLSLHSVAAACLLQPVKWHMRKPDPEEKGEGEDLKETELQTMPLKGAVLEEVQEENEEEEEERVKQPMLSPGRRLSTDSRKSGATPAGRFEGGAYWAQMGSVQSMQSMELGGSLLAIDAEHPQAAGNGNSHHQSRQHNTQANGRAVAGEKPSEKHMEKMKEDEEKEEADEEKKTKDRSVKGVIISFLHGIVSFFDLTLLRDPIYVNLMLGMSIAVFAELNFSLMTPFMLGERNFDTQGIATLVSMIAVADIVFRFLSPFVKKLCGQSIRVMYMIGLALLFLTRTLLIFAYDYQMVTAVMFALGVAKGIRTVFWTLVIPDYVPIDRLPAASGIQSVTNGLVFLALGPLVGVIRDRVGSYNAVIVVVNALTLLTLFMWSAEFLIVAIRRRRGKGKGTKQDVEKT